jgi:uncharacterized membrane protein (UPF0182 family)
MTSIKTPRFIQNFKFWHYALLSPIIGLIVWINTLEYFGHTELAGGITDILYSLPVAIFIIFIFWVISFIAWFNSSKNKGKTQFILLLICNLIIVIVTYTITSFR